MDLLIVTGMSGAGKTTALKALEDIGFHCIDNFPPSLFSSLMDLIQLEEKREDKKIAITVDVRSAAMFSDLQAMLAYLDKQAIRYRILFIDADPFVLLKRFKESRRSHPLMDTDVRTIEEAIEKEAQILEFLRGKNDFLIDSSDMIARELKEQVIEKVGVGMHTEMVIHFVSFGFKHGILQDADLVFDLRCLPNPFYYPELRPLTGQDQKVRDFVMKDPDSQTLYQHIFEYLNFSVPLYQKEGKSQLVVGIACTGGQHRSVTFVELLYRDFHAANIVKVKRHRDIRKG